MRCLYEVLGIDRDADDSQIKVAYRKGALRWHPDKNQDNLKEAEDRFKELQNAYEVLSDKHERAWYDSHRSDILRQGNVHQAGGSNSFTPGQAPEDEINLYPYFSSTCFSGYSDGPAGYYGVYEQIFSKLFKQEEEAAQQSGDKDSGPLEEPPLFGMSTAPWHQVAGFYSHWLNFSTCKSFSWADQYNPAAAPNRKVRRLMEAENAKARKAKRREYNETVRELAAFVRKRDKRVAAHQAQQAQLRLEKEEEERKRQERERRERMQRAREFEEAAWAQAQEEGLEEEEEDGLGDIPEELFCPACDKSFRSHNAFANHERSKKHLERVEVLRQLLEEEEETAAPAADFEPSDAASEGEVLPESIDADTPTPPDGGRAGKRSKKAKKKAARARAGGLGAWTAQDTADGSPDDELVAAAIESDAERPRVPPAAAESVTSNESADEDSALDALLNMQTARMQQADDGTFSASEAESTDGPEEPSRPEIRESARDAAVAGLADRLADTDIAGGGVEEPPAQNGKKKKGAKAKKEKRKEVAASKDPISEKQSRRKGRQAEVADPPATECSICGESFSSRSKLFKHIRDTGHAALKG